MHVELLHILVLPKPSVGQPGGTSGPHTSGHWLGEGPSCRETCSCNPTLCSEPGAIAPLGEPCPAACPQQHPHWGHHRPEGASPSPLPSQTLTSGTLPHPGPSNPPQSFHEYSRIAAPSHLTPPHPDPLWLPQNQQSSSLPQTF